MSDAREWQRALPRPRFVWQALTLEVGCAGICSRGRFRRWSGVAGSEGQLVGVTIIGAAPGRTWVINLGVGSQRLLATEAPPEALTVSALAAGAVWLPRVYPLARLRLDLWGPAEGVLFVLELENGR